MKPRVPHPVNLAIALWGTFAVPNNPSRKGSAPVAIPGALRLALELAFLGFAVWTLFDSTKTTMAVAFGVAVFIHYAVSYDRIAWLLRTASIRL